MHGQQLGVWDPDDPAWHDARRTRVGGSEIGTVCGWSRHETRYDLMRRKAGLIAPRSMSDAMWRGRLCEPAVLAWGAHKHQLHPDPAMAGTWVHPDHPFALYNPDGVTADGVLIEAKTTSNRGPDPEWPDGSWGRAGSDQIPLTYAAQVQWGLGVLGLETARVLVLAGAINGRPDLHFAQYKVRASTTDFRFLLGQAQQFIADLAAMGEQVTNLQETA